MAALPRAHRQGRYLALRKREREGDGPRRRRHEPQGRHVPTIRASLVAGGTVGATRNQARRPYLEKGNKQEQEKNKNETATNEQGRLQTICSWIDRMFR